LFDGSHDALLGSNLIALNLHYSEFGWEAKLLVKKARLSIYATIVGP
jgi:hypothetical protein